MSRSYPSSRDPHPVSEAIGSVGQALAVDGTTDLGGVYGPGFLAGGRYRDRPASVRFEHVRGRKHPVARFRAEMPATPDVWMRLEFRNHARGPEPGLPLCEPALADYRLTGAPLRVIRAAMTTELERRLAAIAAQSYMSPVSIDGGLATLTMSNWPSDAAALDAVLSWLVDFDESLRAQLDMAGGLLAERDRAEVAAAATLARERVARSIRVGRRLLAGAALTVVVTAALIIAATSELWTRR